MDTGSQQSISHTSVLRYPGGKSRAVKIITRYFPDGITELCSPFFGGGSIELYMAAKGVKVYGYDVFKPLVEFWQCLFEKPRELANAVRRYYPLDKKTFYNLQRRQCRYKIKLKRAAVFYVLNRSSFSGATLSGGMSSNHPRFTPSSIERLNHFYNPHVSVRHLDFHESIQLHQNTFLYLDPPYLSTSKLYGVKGSAHSNFDHRGLCNILRKRNNWILSYNDCKEVREMYQGYTIKTVSWKYGMSKKKAAKELLIFSNDIHAKKYLDS